MEGREGDEGVFRDLNSGGAIGLGFPAVVSIAGRRALGARGRGNRGRNRLGDTDANPSSKETFSTGLERAHSWGTRRG